MLFDIRSFERGGWTVVSVVGDVDLATMPRLHAELRGAAGNVALDLSGVELLDPLSLGVLLAAASRARRSEASFVVICPDGRQRHVLSATRADEILELVDSADDLPAG